MPGLVLFKRRWAIGADDLVVPCVFLAATHAMWAMLGLVAFLEVHRSTNQDECNQLLQIYSVGYCAMMCLAVILEICVGWICTHGSIMDTSARRKSSSFLYTRCALFLMECFWMVFGAVCLVFCYEHHPPTFTTTVLLGTIIWDSIMLVGIVFGIYLSYDLGGGKWLKLRKYEANVQSTGSKLHHHHGSNHRNWRTRKAVRAYQTSWDRRCQFLFCCLSTGQRTSLGEIAQLLSDFFRDLDLVPSDIVAGLILLRRYQKLRRHALLAQNYNSTYEFLSGAPITEDTKFLNLTDQVVLGEYKRLLRYMRFSLAVYGYPMYVCRGNTCCKLMKIVPGLRCFCCFWLPQRVPGLDVLDDNCCQCNSSAMWAVMEPIVEDDSIQFVHASYTGGVGVTPYFLALDHQEQKIVVSIRGTLSMKDIITDLNADAEFIPVVPLQTNPPWLAHKGMIIAAEYVKKKLIEEGRLKQMLELAKKRSGRNYDLLLVGHSLGGGTAAILALMLKNDFPTLKCICYSPPGGLMNLPAAEFSKSFITTCLLGKDMVARLGLHQLEAMRSDLLNVIQRSTCPKYIILGKGISGCCSKAHVTDPALRAYADEQAVNFTGGRKVVSPYMTTHPPMYLPGKIIHIVRRYPSSNKFGCKKAARKGEPIYQAIEAERENFYELTLSPSMLDDHMPDTLLSAMEKVLDHIAPVKPRRLQKSTSMSDSPPEDSFELSNTSWSGSGHPLQSDQPRLSVSSAAFASDLNLPYADLTGLNSPGNLLSPSHDSASPIIPSSCDSRSTTPQVRIYACLFEEGMSADNTDLTPSLQRSSSPDFVEVDVHQNHRNASNVNEHEKPNIVKAKSLNELASPKKARTSISHHSSKLHPEKKTREKRSSSRSSNLQIPNQSDFYNSVNTNKSPSQKSLMVNRGKHGDHIYVKRSSVGSDVCFHINESLPTKSSRSIDGSFSSLPERTEYGTIYYV